MKKTFLIICLSAVLCAANLAQNVRNLNQNFDDVYTKMTEAFNSNNYSDYEKLCYELLQYVPEHPSNIYDYAKALSLNDKIDESIREIKRIVDYSGLIIKQIESDSIFSSKLGEENLEKITAKFNKYYQPVNNSNVAFEIAEKKLIPEGVAYNNNKDELFVSSIYLRKIIKINKKGVVSNFINEKQDDILTVLGMEVDEQRNHLWVCSAWSGRIDFLDIDKNKKYYSSVYKYDLNTGSLVKKYTVADEGEHLFNDLAISAGGDVYITDTYSGEVYKISNVKDELEIYLDNFLYPNGITISDDSKELFVADYSGVYKIDLTTKENVKLSLNEKTTLVQIDGLAFYKNSLIAHQGSVLGGIIRYYLNDSMDSVIKKEPLELHNSLFDFPTTGEIAGNDYYYIANAQLRKFNSDGSLFPEDKLSEVYILKLKLD